MQVCQAYRSLADAFIDRICTHRAQAAMLCRLYVQDGLTQSEIGDQLSVQGATVTNMLQRMEEAGLATRRRDPEDNRLVRVYLTQSGREKDRAINEMDLGSGQDTGDICVPNISPREHRKRLAGGVLQLLFSLAILAVLLAAGADR